ncbi:hypothetical protein [Nonomuraea roseoviolacea]|uniref:Uncharacterized protein n=1 Tax=Nonomuraea roseoviolacea subsp. carminata TaxID=160689 RepID=A0ABT1JRZ2_9ACTN|nr:hypothetical protein [Nonomuraea roseoviolacea]MCP2344516.1 hypothetical protein [Nonomuraea roseoviolacea subsp. carminata]
MTPRKKALRKKAPRNKAPRKGDGRESASWWQHPMAKWAGVAVATPVLVGVLVWGIERAVTNNAKPKDEGAPLVVSLVRLERNGGEQANDWVFPEGLKLTSADLSELNALPWWSAAEAEWFRRRGAVDPNASVIKVVIRGNRNAPIRVVGMKAVPRCRSPLAGMLFLSSMVGSTPNEAIEFDLDQADPQAQLAHGDGTYAEFFQERTVSLRRGEDVTLQMTARSRTRYCEFVFAVDVLTDAGVVTQTIDDHGKPFKVTATLEAAAYNSLYVSGPADPLDNPENWRPVDPKTYRN